MKREVSFFKDKRANSASALLATFRALGMSDTEIKQALLDYKQANSAVTPINWAEYKTRDSKWQVFSESMTAAGFDVSHSTEWSKLKTQFNRQVTFSDNLTAENAAKKAKELGAEVSEVFKVGTIEDRKYSFMAASPYQYKPRGASNNNEVKKMFS